MFFSTNLCIPYCHSAMMTCSSRTVATAQTLHKHKGKQNKEHTMQLNSVKINHLRPNPKPVDFFFFHWKDFSFIQPFCSSAEQWNFKICVTLQTYLRIPYSLSTHNDFTEWELLEGKPQNLWKIPSQVLVVNLKFVVTCQQSLILAVPSYLSDKHEQIEIRIFSWCYCLCCVPAIGHCMPF